MCQEGIIWEVVAGTTSSFVQYQGDLEESHALFYRQWPEAPSGLAPNDTPENTARFFEQGTSSLESGNFDAAGVMFRKTLESATKILDVRLSSQALVKRIDSLATDGRITSDLAQWAHEVRLGGNEAAHDDELFSESDAQDLRNFVENFLRYAFTLPSAVRRREGRSSTAA